MEVCFCPSSLAFASRHFGYVGIKTTRNQAHDMRLFMILWCWTCLWWSRHVCLWMWPRPEKYVNLETWPIEARLLIIFGDNTPGRSLLLGILTKDGHLTFQTATLFAWTLTTGSFTVGPLFPSAEWTSRAPCRHPLPWVLKWKRVDPLIIVDACDRKGLMGLFPLL